MNITPIPERLAKLNELTIHKGSHGSFKEGHCALEVVAWLAGEPHSDSPSCVCPTIKAFTIRLNDRMGPGAEGDKLRAELLRPLLPKMLGTVGSIDLRRRRVYLAANAAIHVFAPMALDVTKQSELAAKLRGVPEIIDRATALQAREAAIEVRNTARKHAAADAAADADADAADAAAAAADAADAAADAAAAAADAAAAAAAAAADAAAADAARQASRRTIFEAGARLIEAMCELKDDAA